MKSIGIRCARMSDRIGEHHARLADSAGLRCQDGFTVYGAACGLPGWGAKATVGQSLFARPCDGACSTMAEPACVTAAGGADPFVSVAVATARTQLAAIRASELELVRYGAAWTRAENLQLLASWPLRRRQRLPVQLWGQLQRPCRVLGAATDSWSLPPRCSAAMTRGGRARLAAGATETTRLVGIRALCRWSQHRGWLLFRLKRHPITRNLPGAEPDYLP